MPRKAIDRATDELYALPPGDFTKARDELARQLRKEGQRAEADAVKALRKPTAAAGALNQLARRQPKDVEQLLAAGNRLRKAHEALLGGGDRSALQKASAEEREVVDRLARDATAVAAEAGSTPSATLDEHIRNTLHAAALDEQTAAELAGGRLLRERDAVGVFGTATAEPATKSKPQPADKPRDRKDSQKAKRELAAARGDEQRAQREHASAVKATQRAARDADEARRRAEEARTGLREAQQREKDAAKAADRAARAVAAAQKKLG